MLKINRTIQNSLNTKLTLLFLIIGLIPLSITVGITILLTNDVLQDVAIEEEQNRVRNEADIINRFLTTTVDDLSLLRNSNTMRALVGAIAERNSLELQRLRRQLEQEFITFTENRTFSNSSIYEHIRFLDANGFEFVRIDNVEGNANPVFSVNLNARSNTDYFMATQELEEGEIYVTPLKLFEEYGEIQEPFTPVIQYATPLYEGDTLIGVLVLDIRAQGFLDLLREHSDGTTFLLDSDGYYLLHRDASKTFGRDLGTNFQLQTDRPDLEFVLSSSDSGVYETKDDITFYRTIVPPGQTGRSWVLVSTLDLDSILVLVRQQQTVLLISLVTVAGIVAIIALIFARNISQPIVQMTNTAIQIADGDLQRSVRISRDDEIGRLGTAFNQMTQQLRDVITGLEDRVRERTRELELSNRVKSQFLASMSHELRTPLNAIINFSKFVAKGQLGPVNEEQSETLFEVVDSAKHLLNLINDVLDMSKIESGSLNLFVVDDVDLKAIINQVVSTGNALLEDKPVEIRTEIAENLPGLRCDRQRIFQILLNLMSNACKFTLEGSITIHAYQNADEVTISIADTGPGIAEEDQEAVFQAFQQTESGIRQGGGTGLGLPITKNLVEAHGGRIRLESQAGTGTTFIIHLPVKSDVLVPTLI